MDATCCALVCAIVPVNGVPIYLFLHFNVSTLLDPSVGLGSFTSEDKV